MNQQQGLINKLNKLKLLGSILAREGLLTVVGDESLLLMLLWDDRDVVELFRLSERLLLLLRLPQGLRLRLSELEREVIVLVRAVAGLLILVGQETLLAVDLLLLRDMDKLGLTVGHWHLPDREDKINYLKLKCPMFHSPALLPLDVLALGLGLHPAVCRVLHLEILCGICPDH